MADQQDAPAAEEPEGAINFASFVLSLAHTAAFHFGDVPDPMTGAASEPNLPAAQQMIEILAPLEQKTRGNLTAQERQLLEQLLYELRLRYVEAEKASPPDREQPRIIIP